MNWQRLTKLWQQVSALWQQLPIVQRVGICAGIALTAWLFLAFGPTACFSFLQTLILGVGAYFGLKTWRLDIEKRYDPFRQEVHRQQIAVYGKLTGHIEKQFTAGLELLELAKAGQCAPNALKSFNELRGYNGGLFKCFFGEGVLFTHASVCDDLSAFNKVMRTISLACNQHTPMDNDRYSTLHKQTLRAYFQCVNHMSRGLGIAELSTNFEAAAEAAFFD